MKAINYAEGIDNVAYALSLARAHVMEPYFALSEVNRISASPYRGSTYSEVARHRFGLGGSALLTAMALRACEKQGRPLSSREVIKFNGCVKSQLKHEYVENVSHAISFVLDYQKSREYLKVRRMEAMCNSQK